MATERDSAGAQTLLAGELLAAKLLQLFRLVRRRVAQLIRHHEEDVRPAIAVLRAHDFPFAHVAHSGARPSLRAGRETGYPRADHVPALAPPPPGGPALSLCPTVVMRDPWVSISRGEERGSPITREARWESQGVRGGPVIARGCLVSVRRRNSAGSFTGEAVTASAGRSAMRTLSPGKRGPPMRRGRPSGRQTPNSASWAVSPALGSRP